MSRLKLGLVIPTYKPGAFATGFCAALKTQKRQPVRTLVIDSGSSPAEIDEYRKVGAEIVEIPPGEFDHGLTRNLAIQMMPDVDVVIFMTQDAILASPTSLATLIDAIADPEVALAYGRQLPRPEAGPVERYARLSAYPDGSSERTAKDIERMGIRAAYASNSFAAYRVSCWREIGGFSPTIFGEDMLAAAKFLLAGKKIRYVADAVVTHSHDFSVGQTFRRYFDIGAFHASERAILRRFGATENAGMAYVIGETRYLVKERPLLIPYAALLNLTKLLAYRLGKSSPVLPLWLCRALSSNVRYWRRHGDAK